MSAFGAMLATVFADPNHAADAVYTPPDGGPGVPCRAAFRAPDHDWRFQDAGVTSPARIAEVRAAEVASIEEEGTLTVGGRTYTVTKASRPDADRLVWRLELA